MVARSPKKRPFHGAWLPVPLQPGQYVGQFLPDAKHSAQKALDVLCEQGFNVGLQFKNYVAGFEDGCWEVSVFTPPSRQSDLEALLQAPPPRHSKPKPVAAEQGQWTRLVDDGTGQVVGYEGHFNKDKEEAAAKTARHLWREGILNHQKQPQMPEAQDLQDQEGFTIRLMRAAPREKFGDNLPAFEKFAHAHHLLERAPEKKLALGKSHDRPAPPSTQLSWERRSRRPKGNSGPSLFD